MMDMIPDDLKDGGIGYRPVPAGSSLNTAIGLARLGTKASLLSPLSTDMFGDQLTSTAALAGVDFSLSPWVDRPSTLSFAGLQNDPALPQFFDQNSALRTFAIEELPEVPDGARALHVGGLAFAAEPSGTTLEEFTRRAIGGCIISFDPGIRPQCVDNDARYRDRLERMFDLADILSVTEADLDWFDPGASLEGFAHHRLANGASLVITTSKENVYTAYSNLRTVQAVLPQVDVVDTIGARDFFLAGLLASLASQNNLSANRIGKLNESDTRSALTLASTAAAISTTRAGAKPPTKAEIVTFLKQSA